MLYEIRFRIESERMTSVAAAVIKNNNNEILICQRGKGGSCAYLWEFPGGKLENDESMAECIIRECKEELNISVTVKSTLSKFNYSYPERDIAFTFFEAKIINGTLKMNVHNDIKWVKAEDLKNYKFCPAD